VREVTMDEFQEDRDAVLSDSGREAQVIMNDGGVVMVIGSEGDAGLPEDTFDEGPIVSHRSATVPSADDVESEYFAKSHG
jgi:hypothetical protein